MTFDRFAQWVGMLANIGVLAGFIFVAYQLQLNTTALQTTSSHKTNELFSTLEASLMGDTGHQAWAKALTAPNDITPEEMSQMWTLQSMSQFVATQTYIDFQNGVTSEAHWTFVAEHFIAYNNHPIGRTIWESGDDIFLDPLMIEFRAEINAKWDKTPKNLTQKKFIEMIERYAKGVEPDA